MIIHVPKFLDIDVEFSNKIESFVTLRAKKDGKVIATYTAKNAITDDGLDLLRNESLSTILGYVNLVNKHNGDTSVVTNPPANQYTRTFDTVPCEFPAVGNSDYWQDSWVEGWTNNLLGADVNTGAADYTYYDFSRTWAIVPEVAFDVATRTTQVPQKPQVDGGSFDPAVDITSTEPYAVAGGVKTGISHFFISDQQGLDTVTFGRGCTTPPDPPNNATLNIHKIPKFWNHGQFKDIDGNPIDVTFVTGVEFDFTYTVRLHIPVDPIVQVMSGFIMTTRAHCAHLETCWGASRVSSFVAGAAVAFENDAMPALNVAQSNAPFAGPGEFASATGLNPPPNIYGTQYNDGEYNWGPSVANFATGIGSITHGTRGAGQQFAITTFSPKIPKTNTKRVVFKARYSWDRVGGI